MSMDGVVPPQGGPSRRPAGGSENQPGAATPQGPAAWDAASSTSGTPDTSGTASTGSEGYVYPLFDAGTFGDTVGDEPFSAAEASLANALRVSVAGVGQAGPPPGGLLRIRRRARLRQRNRMIAAGSAGVLVLAVAVTMATGARFDLVPTLTGAAGASGGSASGNPAGAGGSAHPSVAVNGGHVVWPTGSPGKIGLAIGPVAPVVSTPSAAAAAELPLCTATSLKANTTVGPTVNGVVYGRVDAVAQSSCVVVGPPVLTVANQAGTASTSVAILKENLADASQLPSVPTWGNTIMLKAGQGYQFQFAWAATACAQTSTSPSQGAPNPLSAASMYYLGYAVTGTTPTAVVTLSAPCGAQVYVTDIYNPGAFPLPKAPSSSPPTVSTPAVPPSSSVPPPPTSSAPPSTSPPASSPSPSPSDSSSDPGTSSLSSGQATPPSG